MSYFCHSTLPAFQQCEPSPLWEYMKQELYHSPSMCFMAIAIGYEHQAARVPSSSSSTQSSIFNARAVQSLRQTIEDAEAYSTSSTMFTVVFHSLLLVILHCFRKSFTEVGIHLEHGLRIAWEATMRYDMATEVPLRESLRLLKQYCIAMALFNPLLPQQALHSAQNSAPNQALANPESLKSISGPLAVSADDQVVQGELEDLVLDLIGTTLTPRRPHIDLDTGGDLTFAEPLTVDEALLEKISAFRARHVALEAAIDRRLASKTVQRAQQFKLAKARCMTIGVYIRCRWSGYQCHFDVEMETFRQIIDLAETYLAQELQRTADGSEGRSEPLVFLGHGLLSTLSFVSRLCRQQDLRHRALSVMARCEGQDGPWSSELAVLICKAVIAYEERKALQDDPSFAVTGYIPEHCRVRYHYYYNVINDHDGGTRRDSLRVFRMRQGSQSDFVHEDIDLDTEPHRLPRAMETSIT
ncbi:unnamed protein product [Cercospora beticola]|nr:unnamed protein product [Cercospora beticola]